MVTVATWTYKEHMTASTPRNARTPVLYRCERVPGLFERTLGDGSKVYECKTRAAFRNPQPAIRNTIDHGGRLEAEALPPARGQDDDAVARGEDRVHRVALQRPEIGEPPDAVERLGEERISVVRICARRTHRPDAGTPPRARRTTRAGW